MHGLEKVRVEFSLTALAFNSGRAIPFIDRPALVPAIQA